MDQYRYGVENCKLSGNDSEWLKKTERYID